LSIPQELALPRPSRHHSDQRLAASRRPLAVLVALIALATVTACSGGGKLNEGAAGPARPGTSQAAPPAAGGPPFSLGPAAQGIGDDPALPRFGLYLDARYAALLARDGNFPALVATATALRLESDRRLIEQMRAKNWTLHGRPRWVVVGIRAPSAGRKIVEGCLWDSSVYIADSAGKPTQPYRDRWLPYETELTLAGDRWLVNSAGTGKYSCENAR
jgi:hypothetical protein